MFNLSIRKAILGVVAAGSSFVIGGAILDAVSNAISQIRWPTTIIGTSAVGLSWLALRVLLATHPIQWHGYRITRLGYYPACAFAGIVLLLWTPPIVNHFEFNSKPLQSIREPSRKEARIVVLLSDFTGPNSESYGVTQIVFEQLVDATKGYSDVKIRRLNQGIDSSEVAQTKGREAKADIVLWGSYFVNQSNTRVITHFEVIEKTFDIPLRNDREIISARTTKLESFALQEKLSREMSYLVLTTVGIIQVEDLDFDGAISSFSKALSLSTVAEQIIDPRHLYDYRAISYLMKGMLDEAASDFSQAIGYGPEADLLYMRAVVHVLQGNSSQAISDLGQSLRLEASDQTYTLRGFVQLHLRNDPQLALADFNRALELNPNSIGARLNRSVLHQQQDNLEAALGDLDRVINLEPKSSAHNNRGTVYTDKGDFERAIVDYSKAIEIDPQNIAAYFNRSNLYSKLHYLDKALADSEEVIKLDAQLGKPYTIRGTVYAEKGMLDEAIQAYTRAIELKGDEETYGDYYNRGAIYHRKGEFDRAIEDYDKSIKLNSHFAASYGNRCNTYLAKTNFNQAISDCTKAIRLNSQDSGFFTSRGAALASLKRFALAMADFDRAILLDNNNIRAYLDRGIAFGELGQRANAIADFRKVITLGSDEAAVKVAKHNLCVLGTDCS